jgi:hypothetical protein
MKPPTFDEVNSLVQFTALTRETLSAKKWTLLESEGWIRIEKRGSYRRSIETFYCPPKELLKTAPEWLRARTPAGFRGLGDAWAFYVKHKRKSVTMICVGCAVRLLGFLNAPHRKECKR